MAFPIGLAGSWPNLTGISSLSTPDPGEQPYTFAALLLMFTTVVVGVVYCLDSLYGERRDRSILFWKSMPVSDATAVLAKAAIPIVVLPLVTFGVTFVTQVLMLAMARAAGHASSMSFGRLTTELFTHLLLGHGLWYAPIWGWLLFCSALARRVPLLWATLPPLALGLVERIAFNTSYFVTWLSYRLAGGPAPAMPNGPQMTMAAMTPTAAAFFTDRGLWTGLALFGAFLALAVYLRRTRGPN
jgi:ABC-2 type transport system permease protein